MLIKNYRVLFVSFGFAVVLQMSGCTTQNEARQQDPYIHHSDDLNYEPERWRDLGEQDFATYYEEKPKEKREKDSELGDGILDYMIDFFFEALFY